DIPQFLDADAVALRVDIVELLLRNEFLGERAARAFGEDSDFGAKFVAGSVVVLEFAVLVEALVFRNHACDCSVFGIDQRGAAEFLEDVDTRGFDQAAKPLYDFVERDDVVALVLEWRGWDRKAEGGVLREIERGGIGDSSIERSGLLE